MCSKYCPPVAPGTAGFARLKARAGVGCYYGGPMHQEGMDSERGGAKADHGMLSARRWLMMVAAVRVVASVV